MAGKFQLKKTSNGQFHFTLKAGNGEPILSSETYAAKAGAQNGIESVKTNAPDDNRYERKTGTNGQPYFVLKAANGEPLGRGETYSSQSAMERGIEAVKNNALGSAVEDLT